MLKTILGKPAEGRPAAYMPAGCVVQPTLVLLQHQQHSTGQPTEVSGLNRPAAAVLVTRIAAAALGHEAVLSHRSPHQHPSTVTRGSHCSSLCTFLQRSGPCGCMQKGTRLQQPDCAAQTVDNQARIKQHKAHQQQKGPLLGSLLAH